MKGCNSHRHSETFSFLCSSTQLLQAIHGTRLSLQMHIFYSFLALLTGMVMLKAPAISRAKKRLV